MPKLRVFLADDHVVIREGLKAILESQPDIEVAGEASDGQSACREAKHLAPDVIVMDVSMPGMNGAKATELLCRDRPATRVLALTVHEDRAYLRLLIRSGAAGYLLKRASSHDLIRAIRTVAAGGTFLDPALVGDVLESFVRRTAVGNSARAHELSERECEVMRLIARGYSNKEIAAKLEVSTKTVETYKSRSMEKLGLSSRSDIVDYSMERGWLGL